jgi:Uncharacterised protein family (UPF0236)
LESSTGTTAGRKRLIKTVVGELTVSEKQAQKLDLKPRKRLSPMVEKNCLLLSANVSYANAARDFKELTGIDVGHSTQQRLVHRTTWKVKSAESTVLAVSVDGGKARIRTPEKGPNGYLDYKAIALHGSVCGAWFQENGELLKYANSQPLAPVVSCLGDGHKGIWNIMAGIKEPETRREVLDWYHLMENLHKVGGSEQRRKEVRAELWQGNIAGAKRAFDDWENPPEQVTNFLQYLEDHKNRIPNYKSDQEKGLCIGSGAVESTIKRISARIKISGAQWNMENLSNVLKQRCEYLNRYLVPG